MEEEKNCCLNIESKAGTENNFKSTILWIVIAILAIAVIYILFFRGATSTSIALGKIARQTVSGSSGMVGGC